MIIHTLVALVNLYCTLIIIYALMSWIPNVYAGTLGQIYGLLGKVCDPYLNLFKRFIPPIGGTVDISPIIALLVLQFLMQAIVKFF